jgi:hypothetical protein
MNTDLNSNYMEYLGDLTCASNQSILSMKRAAQPYFMYKYAQLIFSSSLGNWFSVSHMYSLQELRKTLLLA